MTTTTPTNTDDAIDSRDVIARIEELQAEIDGIDPSSGEDCDDEKAELAVLLALQDECDFGDRKHGAILIRDTYFKEYAQELAEDIGAIDPKAGWPCLYIDWDAAADALLQDYTSVGFDGVDYWIRA